MPTPKVYTKIRKAQKEVKKEVDKGYKQEHKEHLAEERQLFKEITTALKPYDKTTLDGEHVTVTIIPNKKLAKVFVNKNHWLTFGIERSYSFCGCENSCNHEAKSWIYLEVIQHRKDGEFQCYFTCDKSNLNDETEFASAMAQMMDDYDDEYSE